jgi:hypothetical protein
MEPVPNFVEVNCVFSELKLAGMVGPYFMHLWKSARKKQYGKNKIVFILRNFDQPIAVVLPYVVDLK